MSEWNHGKTMIMIIHHTCCTNYIKNPIFAKRIFVGEMNFFTLNTKLYVQHFLTGLSITIIVCCTNYIKKPYYCKTHLCARNKYFYLKHKTVCSTLFNRSLRYRFGFAAAKKKKGVTPRQNVFINEWFSKKLFSPFKIKKKRKINHECFFLLDEKAFFSIKKKIIST